MAHNSVPSKLKTEVLFPSGKYLSILAMLVLSFGIVAAHDIDYKKKYSETYYSGDDLRIVSKTTWTYYDNENRYSTKDYQYGYSFRASGDYFDRKYSDVVYVKGSHSSASYWKKDFGDYRNKRYNSGYRYYYEYVPHLRTYEKRGCYMTPPEGKLFYIKC